MAVDAEHRMTAMPACRPEAGFEPINRGFATVFRAGRLSLGLVVPIETYVDRPIPSLERHLERVQLAEELGFAAVWLRDVPFKVPSFGDAGQVFDPFVYLGYLAARTDRIGLGVASVVLPLRHPAHVAKAAASADVLSGGRVILGVASGDRPREYSALGIDYETRGRRFRDAFEYLRRMAEPEPCFANAFGTVSGMDMLPKPAGRRLPLLVTGGSQQDPDWIASHGDGWMTYPRDPMAQARVIEDWRRRVGPDRPPKPVMQPLYFDLLDRDDAPPLPLHLGFRSGLNGLRQYLRALETAGVNHVALNLRFNRADPEATLARLVRDLLHDFPTGFQDTTR